MNLHHKVYAKGEDPDPTKMAAFDAAKTLADYRAVIESLKQGWTWEEYCEHTVRNDGIGDLVPGYRDGRCEGWAWSEIVEEAWEQDEDAARAIMLQWGAYEVEIEKMTWYGTRADGTVYQLN